MKEQILKRIKEEGILVSQAAKEHGLNPATIYNWLGRGVKGTPTIGELVRLKRLNEELLALVGELTLVRGKVGALPSTKTTLLKNEKLYAYFIELSNQ
ncbi:MAG: transposase [Candidatus Brennerbacteria bacterium]|nr:transposase [Candidatus Brennerbacteria bacterium]